MNLEIKKIMNKQFNGFISINYLCFSYEEALKLNPNNSSIWNSKGIALSNYKRYEEAIEWFIYIIVYFFFLSYEQALKLNPDELFVEINKLSSLKSLGAILNN